MISGTVTVPEFIEKPPDTITDELKVAIPPTLASPVTWSSPVTLPPIAKVSNRFVLS